MNSKKIKLTASVKKINAKAKPKKKKRISKLKLILADPHKFLIPTLCPYKAYELCDFVHLEITRTGWPGREFAKRFGISLGMASSLRAISSRNTACVLISKAVRPKFILQQIAYFARQRNSRAPVFLVTNLEELSKKMFGVKSSVMAFGNCTSPKIAEWIARQSLAKDGKVYGMLNQTLSAEDTTNQNQFHNFDMNSAVLRKEKNGERIFVPGNVINFNQQIIDERVKKTGEYMPFTNHTCLPRQNIRVTDAELEEGRINMLNKFNKISNREHDTEVLSVNKSKRERTNTHTNPTPKLPKIVYEEYDEDYDFPSSYVRFKTLTFLADKHKTKKKEKNQVG